MIKDPHDPREFRRYVTFANDGTVIAEHDVEASSIPPTTAVEITDMLPLDLSDVVLEPSIAEKIQTSAKDVVDSAQAIITAQEEHAQAIVARSEAIGVARVALRAVVVFKQQKAAEAAKA